MGFRPQPANAVRFKWKGLRTAFAQKSKDLGAPIEAVSEMPETYEH